MEKTKTYLVYEDGYNYIPADDGYACFEDEDEAIEFAKTLNKEGRRASVFDDEKKTFIYDWIDGVLEE